MRYRDSSEARNTMVCPMSSGEPRYGSALPFFNASMTSSGRLFSRAGVMTAPGAMALHRTFCGPYWTAIDLVMLTTAALTAPYEVCRTSPTSAATDAVLMMDPPPARIMWGTACRAPRRVLRMLRATARSNSSMSMRSRSRSLRGFVPPTWLHRTCRSPNSPTAAATMSATEPSSVTSTPTGSARPPAASMSAAVSSAPRVL